jgi:hypothetical protein
MPGYDVSARSAAAPSTIQHVLVDMQTWPRWQSFDSVAAIPASSGHQGPAETGTVWALCQGRTRTEIEIVDIVPGRGLGYIALRLVGMREYRADISLTPLPEGGTDIRWRATFTPTLPVLSRLWEWYLARNMRAIVAALAAYAETQQARRDGSPCRRSTARWTWRASTLSAVGASNVPSGRGGDRQE